MAVEVLGPLGDRFDEVLTKEALEFVEDLHHRFDAQRRHLLSNRRDRQQQLDAGYKPDFLTETEPIRSAEWQVAAPQSDLLDRRVEITGPVERKMMINALNSGAKVFMADFEDANSPTWRNMVEGQLNLAGRTAAPSVAKLADAAASCNIVASVAHPPGFGVTLAWWRSRLLQH